MIVTAIGLICFASSLNFVYAQSSTLQFKSLITQDLAGPMPQNMEARDFNNDNHLDLVVQHYRQGGSGDDISVAVFFGDGAGRFEDNKAFATGYITTDLAVGDFNHDNSLDLAPSTMPILNSGAVPPCGLEDAFPIFLGNGKGIFTQQTPCVPYIGGVDLTAYSIAAADFNNDNNTDLAVTRAGNFGNNNVSIYLGAGNGTFMTPYTFNINWPVDLLARDLNGDGRADLVVSTYSGPIILLSVEEGNLSASGGLAIPGSSRLGITKTAAIDINGDFLTDLVVTEQNNNLAYVFIGNGDGSFQIGAPYQVDADPADVTVADLNLDGNQDIIVTSYSQNILSILIGKGDGSFLPKQTFAVGVQPIAVVSGDWNEDGWPDLAVANQNLGEDGTVSILMQNPSLNADVNNWILH